MSVFCYQHNIPRWRRKTSHLPLEKKGAYRELMDAYYENDGRIPYDLKKIYRILGVQTQSERRAIAEIVEEFFEEKDGYLSQKTCDEELQRIYKKSEKARSSARAKHNKNNDNPPANAQRTDKPTHSEGICERSANNEQLINISSEAKASSDITADAVCVWNALADEIGLAKVLTLTGQRKSKLRARIRQAGDFERWKAIIKKIPKIPWMFDGSARNGWTADFDFVLQEKSFTKLMEGVYDDRGKNSGKNNAGRANTVNGQQPTGSSWADEGKRLADEYREQGRLERERQGQSVGSACPSLCPPEGLRQDESRTEDTG